MNFKKGRMKTAPATAKRFSGEEAGRAVTAQSSGEIKVSGEPEDRTTKPKLIEGEPRGFLQRWKRRGHSQKRKFDNHKEGKKGCFGGAWR